MNFKLVFKNIGLLLMVESVCMLPALLVAIIYADGTTTAFAVSAAVLLLCGMLLYSLKPDSTFLRSKEGLAITSIGWLAVVLFGTLPYILSGAIPQFENAFFESMSGLTTTGASILTDLEVMPKAIMFWRSFSNWIGGMGVLMLMLAILPSYSGSYIHIMNAESTGPLQDKMLPKVKDIAKTLYKIYIALSALQVVFLLFGGLSLYDALIHTFATAGTGGLTNKNLSIAAFGSTYVEIVIMVFMFLFGINFSLFYISLKGKAKSALKDEEFRFYCATLLIFTAVITVNISPLFSSLWETLRTAAFQVVSIVTTTSFFTADYALWPIFSQCILMFLMFWGACAGSTTGGFKCVRILLLFKIAKREIYNMLHPNAVKTIHINGKPVPEKTISNVLTYFFINIAVIGIGTLIVALEGKDLVTTFTSVAASVCNIGPGLGIVGPLGDYSTFSAFSKYFFSFCMFLGRLEVFPVLILFSPDLYRKNH